MQTFSIDVKWRMHIVGATARGVTAAGRTMAMTAIVDGAELLSTFIVILLLLGHMPATFLLAIAFLFTCRDE